MESRKNVMAFFLKIRRKKFVLDCEKAWNCIKKRLQHRCFYASFIKFLRTLFFAERLEATAASVVE